MTSPATIVTRKVARLKQKIQVALKVTLQEMIKILSNYYKSILIFWR